MSGRDALPTPPGLVGAETSLKVPIRFNIN
jgi:hypothetical protein